MVTVGPSSGCDYVTNGTADDVQILQAISDLNKKGVIQLMPNVTYDITNPLLFTGLGTDNDNTSHQIAMYGGGYSTVLNVTASNTDCIQLKNGVSVDLRNFKIVEPNTSSGHGIYGLDTGTQYTDCAHDSYYDQIYVYGCDSTHYNMYFKNIFNANFGYISLNSGNGSNLMFDQTSGSTRGGVHFKYIRAWCNTAGKYAVTLQSLVNTVF
jgi:hypothetical protein